MSNVDQFESVFLSAVHDAYVHEQVEFSKGLIISDLNDAEAQEFAAGVRQFLPTLNHDDNPDWRIPSAGEFKTTADLLKLVEASDPDLIVTYRNLHSVAWRFPHSLGSQLDVLLQRTNAPVLVLPHPGREKGKDLGSLRLSTVMAMTDHLSNDHRLVSHAVRFADPGGKLLLTHIEDELTFERFMEAIARIPTIDTAGARETIARQLLKQPRDFVQSCKSVLADAGVKTRVEEIVEFGRQISSYRALIEEHEIDLLVMNTKDEDQLAMHGLAYPLAVELRDTPLLMV